MVENIQVDQQQVVLVVLVVEERVVAVVLPLEVQDQVFVVKDFQVEQVLLILVQLCNKVVEVVELVLLVLDIQVQDLLKEMVEQEPIFHLYLVLVLECQEFFQVAVVAVDMAVVEVELEAQVVEAQVVVDQVINQDQQEQLIQEVGVVDLLQIQQVELVEQVAQESWS